VEFWFSDRSRVILDNAQGGLDRLCEGEPRPEIANDIVPMAGDIRKILSQVRVDDPRFMNNFGFQVAGRGLNEAAIVQLARDRYAANDRTRQSRQFAIVGEAAATDRQKRRGSRRVHVATDSGDRVEGVLLLDPASHTYLYVSRMSMRACSSRLPGRPPRSMI